MAPPIGLIRGGPHGPPLFFSLIQAPDYSGLANASSQEPEFLSQSRRGKPDLGAGSPIILLREAGHPFGLIREIPSVSSTFAIPTRPSPRTQIRRGVPAPSTGMLN